MKSFLVLFFLLSSNALAANVAIMRCADVPNPEKLPDNWPCLVREIGASSVCPADFSPCLVRTTAQLDAYKATHQAAYDAWKAAHPDPTPAPVVSLESRVKAIETRLGM